MYRHPAVRTEANFSFSVRNFSVSDSAAHQPSAISPPAEGSGTEPIPRGPWTTDLLAVLHRIREVRASQLVAAITLRAFLSIFPLLLVAIAVLGFVAAARKGGEPVADQLIRRLSLKDDLAKLVRENVASAQGSRRAASVVGFVSSLYSGLAVITAIAQACDAVWQVPSRGQKDRLLGVPWLIGALVISSLSALASWLVAIAHFPFAPIVGFIIAGLVGAGLFWWTQFVLTNVRVPAKAFLPGALIGGAGLAFFQIFGGLIIARLLKNSSQLYASLAGVFTAISALSLFGWLLVLSAIVNVVRWERQHGTIQLAMRAPALPSSTWAVAERGGQRPKRKKSSRATSLARRFVKAKKQN